MTKVRLENREEWEAKVKAECYHEIEEPKSYPCVAVYYDYDGGSGVVDGPRWNTLTEKILTRRSRNGSTSR